MEIMGFGVAAGLNMLPSSTGAMSARCTTESSGVSCTLLARMAVLHSSHRVMSTMYTFECIVPVSCFAHS